MLNLDDFKVLTFDCYGTLIDWEAGIWDALYPMLTNHHIAITKDKALELYGELESQAECGEYHEYRLVLRMVLEGLGSQLGFAPTPKELQQFSESVKDWPAFSDSASALQALKKKYKLAVISNIDDDLFAFSAQRLQVAFDRVITAQQARSYKPSLNNFWPFSASGCPGTKSSTWPRVFSTTLFLPKRLAYQPSGSIDAPSKVDSGQHLRRKHDPI